MRDLKNWSGLTAIGLVTMVLGVNAYRACTQSITHDEALTHQLFLGDGPVLRKLDRVFLRYDANHHVLHTYLCLLSTTLLGVSEFTMRLPSLCGGAIYLIACVRLCRSLHGPGVVFLMAVALLTLNPFVLDYLSIARGYGLASGFFTWSLFEVVRGLQPTWSGPGTWFTPGHLRKISILLALTVLSNLTFLFASSAVAVLLIAILLSREGEIGAGRLVSAGIILRNVILPGVICFCVLGLPLTRARAGHFYIGEESALQSIAGLVGASLAHHRTSWPWDTSSPGFLRVMQILSTWGMGLFVVALGSLTANLAWNGIRGNGSPLHGKARCFVLIGATFLLTLVMIAILHLALHVKYPSERTGLYLVPLASLCGTCALDRQLSSRGIRRKVGAVAFVGCLLVVGQFVIQFHTSYYRTWQYDSASRRVFQEIERQHERTPARKVRVACSWVLEPSFNFYRASRGAHWMEPVERTVDDREYDYYVDSSIIPLPPRPTSLLFRDETSGTVVRVPNLGTARSPAADQATYRDRNGQ